MGTRGPAPKRSDQRRRRNAPARPVKSATASTKRGRPPVDAKWHPIVKRWYLSLEASGQSKFYEPSDWALAAILAESMTRELTPQPLHDAAGRPILDAKGKPVMVARPPRGAALAAWLKGMSALLVTEGDRRRLMIELEVPGAPAAAGDQPAPVTDLRAWKEGLNA